MKLLAFPCAPELAIPFLAKFDLSQCAAIILKKQENSLADLLQGSGIQRVYTIDEAFYGRVTSHETRETLARIKQDSLTEGYFPLNDFCGNTALLMAALVPRVIAVNPSSSEWVQVELPVQGELCEQAQVEYIGLPVTAGLPETMVAKTQSKIIARIINRLKEFSPHISAMAVGDRAGEKPCSGLIAGFPYDTEVLARYSLAGGGLSGQVLEIGCGLGIGAYLLAKLNPEVDIKAIDNDPEAIELAKVMWTKEEPGGLGFHLALAEDLPFVSASFDTVICFEVIEHLKQPGLLLQEVSRLLKPGGRFIGSTPNYRLYPYQVNKQKHQSMLSQKGPGFQPAKTFLDDYNTPEELRKAGIWPWHLQELDQTSILALLEQFGYREISITYPTFAKGVELYNLIRKSDLEEEIEYLAHLTWSVADFVALTDYYPCFSGFSFLWSGVSRGAEAL